MKGRPAHWPRDLVRRDGFAIVLFALATILMTYPLAFRLGEGLSSGGLDIFLAFWQD